MTLANQLTLLRVALIPVMVLVFFLPFPWSYPVAAIIFALAGITDYFDGYVARRYNQHTAFGAFLDPVADKLMVAVALVLLVQAHASIWLTIPAIVIIGREIVISALREWMAEMGDRTSVAVSFIGKVKTAAQMGSITALLAFPADADVWVVDGGYISLYIAAGLT
ncbi:MAG: CDP-diacylglycerol--glycerol-3-phosphate 3-phosphatidyltransferase, partial [Cellvibrionaceae bacterium]|nr:CDP-diacylglycerol--glycerol-3-phosphate 3-phosphatidyltransferase [Cellvibrionaceae bacterium]